MSLVVFCSLVRLSQTHPLFPFYIFISVFDLLVYITKAIYWQSNRNLFDRKYRCGSTYTVDFQNYWHFKATTPGKNNQLLVIFKLTIHISDVNCWHSFCLRKLDIGSDLATALVNILFKKIEDLDASYFVYRCLMLQSFCLTHDLCPWPHFHGSGTTWNKFFVI